MLVTKLSQNEALRTSCNRCLEHDNTELNWLTAQVTQASPESDGETEEPTRSPSHAVRKAFAQGICYGKTLTKRESVPSPSPPIPPSPPCSPPTEQQDENDDLAGFKTADDRNAIPRVVEGQDRWEKILAPLVKLPGFTTTAPNQPSIALHWDNVYSELPAAPEEPETKGPDQTGPPHGRRSPGPGSEPITAITTPHESDRLQWDDAVMLQNLKRRRDLNTLTERHECFPTPRRGVAAASPSRCSSAESASGSNPKTSHASLRVPSVGPKNPSIKCRKSTGPI